MFCPFSAETANENSNPYINSNTGTNSAEEFCPTKVLRLNSVRRCDIVPKKATPLVCLFQGIEEI